MAMDGETSNGQPDGPSESRPQGPEGASDSRRPIRALLLGFGVMAIAVIALAVFVQLFIAQRIPELTEARIDQAEDRWDQVGPLGYDMSLELRGAQPGEVHVQVRNGSVATMTRNGRTPPPWTWRFWSVPGMFETIERDMVVAEDPVHEGGGQAGAQWQLRCQFDEQYGFPRRYHRYVSGGGPEVYWEVTRFDPR